MANTIFQVKRTTVAGRQPNTTNSSNGQYINPGELALNLADGILYSSNGSALIAIGSNQSNVTTNNVTSNTINSNTISANNITLNQGISVGNSTVNSSINAIGLFAGNNTVNSVINTTFIAVSNPTNNSEISPIIIFSGNSTANAQFNLNAFSEALTVNTYAYDGSNLTIYTTTNTNFVAPTKGQYVTFASLPGAAAKFNNTYEVSGIIAANGFTVYTPLAANISSVQRTSGVATVVTTTPHGFNAGDTVTVAGVPPDPNYSALTYDGTYTVATAPSPNILTYANFPSIVNNISSFWTAGGASNLHFNTPSPHGLANGMYVNIPVFTDSGTTTITGMSFDPIFGSTNAYFSLSAPYPFNGTQNVVVTSTSTNVYSASVSSFKAVGTSLSLLNNQLTVSMPAPHNLDVGSFIQFNGITSGYVNTALTSFTGTVSSTTLTVTAINSNYTISLGQIISGGSITSGTYITGYGTGTGKTGTYTLSSPATVSSPTTITSTSVSLVYLLNNKIYSITSVPSSNPNNFNITLPGTPTSSNYSYYSTTAVTGTSANAYVQIPANLGLTTSLSPAGNGSDFSGQSSFPYTGASASSNTFVKFNIAASANSPYGTAALSGTSGTIPLPRWKYILQGTSVVSGTSTLYGSSWVLTTSSFTGSISGTTLTVTGSPTGTIAIGQYLTGTNVLNGTYIVSGSGTSWVVNQSQTVASTTIAGNAFTVSGHYHPFTTGQWVYFYANPGIYTSGGANIPSAYIGSSIGGWVLITNTSGSGATAAFTIGNGITNLGSYTTGFIPGNISFAGSISGMSFTSGIQRGPYTGVLVSNTVANSTANSFDIAPNSTDIAYTLASGSLGSPKTFSGLTVTYNTDRAVTYPATSTLKYANIATTNAVSGTVSAYNSIYMEVANSSTAVRVTPSTIYTGNSTANIFANSSSMTISGTNNSLQLQTSQITIGTSVNGLLDPTQNSYFANSSVFRLGGGTSKYVLFQAGQATVYGSNLVIGTEIANISMNQSNLIISSNSVVTSINSNNATFGGDVAITGGLIVNGSYGNSGSVLISTGTNTYWGNVPGLDTTQNYSFSGGLSLYSITNVLSAAINFYDNIGNYQTAAANGLSLADTNGFTTLINANTITISDNNTIANAAVITPTSMSIGNSSVNTQTNATHFFTGNSTVYGYGNSTADVLVSPSGNLTLTPTSISIVNTTSNFFVVNASGIFTNTIINATSVYINSTNQVATLQVGMSDSSGGATAWDKTYSIFGPPTLTTTTPALGIGWNSAGGYGEIISSHPGNSWNGLKLKGNLVQLYYMATAGNTSTEGFRLDTGSGNVGIGNTAPADKLSINGTTYYGGNVKIAAGISIIDSTGSQGTVGQVLTSNGSGNVYWAAGGSGSVNTASQYTWTNTQTFSNVITFTGNVIMNASNNVINATSYTVGSTFTANATLVNAAAINITGQTNTATLYVTTSANIGTATVANATGVYTTGTVNAASYTVGTSTIVNATGVYAGIVNATTIQASATFTANATLVNAAAINITGQTNTATLYVTTSANVGTAVVANATGVYTTGIVNATSYTVGASFIANTTGVYAGIVNGSVIQVGSTDVINATGVYTTGTMNATSYTVGSIITANNNGIFTTNVVSSISHLTTSGTFVANNTALYVNSAIFLAGSNGTVGQVLTSNGTSNAYWSTITATINTAAQYTWSNTQTFSNVITFSGNVIMSGANNVINATSYTIGTAFVANTTGVYHTGTVNSATITVGSTTSTVTTLTVTSNTGTAIYGLSNTASGVYGQSNSSFGVVGQSNSSWAVYALSNTGGGVLGLSNTASGVYGQSNTGYGVVGISNGFIGVYGLSNTGTGLYAVSNTGTGLYVQSITGTVATFTNGATTFAGIYANGNVGIGNTTPINQLVIQSPSANQTQGVIALYGANVSSRYTGIDFLCVASATNNKIASIMAQVTNGGPINITGDIIFSTASSGNTNIVNETVRFTGNGNVGVGTTSPAYKIDVTGDIRASANVYGTNLNGAITSSQVTTALGYTPYNATNPASYQLNSTLSANVATMTANNTSFVGTVTAANVVSNAQLQANLGNYQTTAGLSANVATLTANNTSFVGSVSAANVVSNAQLQANLGNYQTTAGLSANVATLTANNTSFVGSVSAANVVSNAQLSANLGNYQTTAGLNANIASYLPIYTGVVNGSSHTVGTGVVANSSGIYSNAGFSSTVNNQRLNFTPIAGGANVFFNQQSDDNFVFYSTNTSNQPRAIWSVFGNNNTSSLNIAVPLQISTNATVQTNTFTLGTSSISANGYSRLPNGLLLQWGTQTAVSNATTTATANFATAFTTLYSVQLTGKGVINESPTWLASTNTTAFIWTTTYPATAASTTINYMAIGI